MNGLLRAFVVLTLILVTMPAFAFDGFFGMYDRGDLGVYSEEKFTALLFSVEGNKAEEESYAGIIAMSYSPFSGRVFWRMKTRGLEDVKAAHIHCKESKAVGASLIPLGIVPDSTWKFVVGVIRVPDTNNVCGWKTMDDLLSAIRSGQAYVNVHTKEYPGGAITGDVLDIGF